MPNINEAASFSNCAYLHSAGEKVREAYAMGRSFPSGSIWEMTASSPHVDASPVRLMGVIRVIVDKDTRGVHSFLGQLKCLDTRSLPLPFLASRQRRQ